MKKDATIEILLISLLQCKVSAVKCFSEQIDSLQPGEKVDFSVTSDFHTIKVTISL